MMALKLNSDMKQEYYKWTSKDKRMYVLSMIPFVVMSIGTLYILGKYSIVVPFIWILIYVIVNLFQAGCCIGCPYRGKYCPAFCGVYLGNFLSGMIYNSREFNSSFFQKNATGGEIALIIFILFPLYWIFSLSWYLVLIYIGLIFMHMLLFMSKQCPKCSYNKVCPGGRAYQNYSKLLKIK